MRGTPYSFSDFRGGVNAESAPYNLEDNEARDARNVVSTARGAIRKRDGAVTFATPPAPLHSLFALAAPTFLIGAGGTKLYRIDSSGLVTEIATVTAGLRWEFVQAPAQGGQGPLYGMNGTDTPKQSTGAGSAADWTASTGAVPNGRYCIYVGNRVFVANSTAFPSRVWWSAPGDPRNWPVANVLDLDPGDGDVVTGLGVIGAQLVVFKSNKAWVIYDLDTGANRRLGENAGCVAHRSIVETSRGTMFLSEDQGVMVTDGSGARRVSDRVKPFLDDIVPAQRGAATAAYFDGHYYLSFSQAGTLNTITLDYDLVLDAWWVHTLAEQDFAVWEPAGTPELYGAKPTALVDRCFVPSQTQDNGVNFRAYRAGPYHVFGTPALRKRVRGIHFDGTGRISVSAAKAFARAEALLGEADFATEAGLYGVNEGALYGINDASLFGGEVEVNEARVATPGVSRAWSIIFANESAQPFEVESYSMFVAARKN